MIDYKYCPQCKFDLDKVKGHPYCKSCNITMYLNPKPAVNGLIIKNNKILLCTRSIPPFKGTLDVVGGFIENGETPQKALIRETKEEVGLEIKPTKLFDIYSDIYGKTGELVLITYYICNVTGGKIEPKSDVSEAHWVPINNIPFNKVGFKNVRHALKDLQKWYQK